MITEFRTNFQDILLRLNCPKGLLSNNFVFLERYDTGVVGDGVAEFGPFCWQGCAEEVENCLSELVERCLVPLECDPIVHGAPKALDWVKIRGICWELCPKVGDGLKRAAYHGGVERRRQS